MRRGRDGGRKEERGNEGRQRVRPPVTMNQRRSICSTLQADMHTHAMISGLLPPSPFPPSSLSLFSLPLLPVAFHAMWKSSSFRHAKPPRLLHGNVRRHFMVRRTDRETLEHCRYASKNGKTGLRAGESRRSRSRRQRGVMSWIEAAQCQGRHQFLASQAETGTRAPGNAMVATHVQATAGHARNFAE